MKKLFLIVAFLMTSSAAYCQQHMTEEFLRGRLACKNPLVYPDLNGSSLQAPVVLSVTFDKEGKLKDEKVLSGHTLLNKSATDYLRGCTYDPLVDKEGAKETSGIITIWFDFQANTPVYGIDLPLIKVLGKDSFEIEGEPLNRDRLIMWLARKEIRKNHPILHIRVKEDSPADILKLLRKEGAGNIVIHYENR
jgi:hypothetical protein